MKLIAEIIAEIDVPIEYYQTEQGTINLVRAAINNALANHGFRHFDVEIYLKTEQ